LTAAPLDGAAMKAWSRWSSVGLSLAIGIALAWLLVFTALTLFAPIIDSFGFRQTQTAINVYSILHDHAFPLYLTPVLGAPWALPLEAPVYQFFVALLTGATGLELDAAGRIVSVAFFCGAVWCGARIVALLVPGDWLAPRLFLLLALASPLYLFWSRTFMVETCALFFMTAWLMCVIEGSRKRSYALLLLSVPLCVLGALAKFTSWPAFVAGYGLLGLAELYRRRTLLTPLILFGTTGVLVALAVGVAWSKYSDDVKVLNTFGAFLTAASLKNWVFGTWAQRISTALWFDIVPKRMLWDSLGYGWPALLLCIVCVRPLSRRTVLAVACLVLFLLPIAIFTNLYMVHDYYATANAIFVIAAVGFLLSEVVAAGRPLVAAFVVVVLLAGAAVRFTAHEWIQATAPLRDNPWYQAALLVKNSTPPASSLIVFGTDWSSEIPYYAERKSVALPGWATPEQARKFLDDPDALMGGLPIGAVVDCRRGSPNQYPPQLDVLVTQFIGKWAQHANLVPPTSVPGSCAAYFSPR